MYNGNARGRRNEKEEEKKYLKEAEIFPKLMADTKSTEPGSSHNTKHDEYEKKELGMSVFKLH